MALGDVPEGVRPVGLSARAGPAGIVGTRATAARTLLAGARARRWAELGLLAVGFGVAYALLVQVGSWFDNDGGANAFFPAAGLALGVLALTRRRTWPVWLAALAAAHVGVQLLHHQPVAAVLWYTVADIAEPVAGALLLEAACPFRGPRPALVRFAVLPVLLAPCLGAIIGATTMVVSSPRRLDWWVVAGRWWVADALGVLVIGSLILAWSQPVAPEDTPPVTAVAAVAAAGAGAVIASGVLWHYPLVYIALPGLVWAAFVGGGRAVTTVGAVTAFAADWVARTGRAGRLLGSAHPGQQREFLQLFLGVTFLTGLILATEIAERRRSESRTLEAERERVSSEEAAVRLAEAERRSITQDTHDIVGHGLSVMLLQLGAVRRVLDSDPQTARELVASIESIGRKACDDLDVALAIVGHHQGRSARPGLDQLPELVDTLCAAGLRVDLRLEGERGGISTLVDWSAYRIVREALTNVVKHAPGASATVTVRFDEHLLSLEVQDDGGGRDDAVPKRDGRGIIGMRERAAALGGTLDVGPNPGHGFAVAAMFPVARP